MEYNKLLDKEATKKHVTSAINVVSEYKNEAQTKIVEFGEQVRTAVSDGAKQVNERVEETVKRANDFGNKVRVAVVDGAKQANERVVDTVKRANESLVVSAKQMDERFEISKRAVAIAEEYALLEKFRAALKTINE